MPLSANAIRRLAISTTSADVGNELTDALNKADHLGTNIDSHRLVSIIIATSTSTTTDFGALAVGDRVLVLPAVAGNAQSLLVATLGTLPQAAVVGTTYLVLRAMPALPAASAFKF